VAPVSTNEQNDPGYLEYPDNVAATYQIATGPGLVRATASWTGAPSLTLSIDCAGDGESGTGASGLVVTAQSGGGTCSVTLALPQGVQATVPYTLDIESAR
jgi:hypothetical protein